MVPYHVRKCILTVKQRWALDNRALRTVSIQYLYLSIPSHVTLEWSHTALSGVVYTADVKKYINYKANSVISFVLV